MHGVVTTFSILNSIVFVTLAIVALRRWRERRDAAAGWVAFAFLALGLLVTVGRFVPAHPHGFFEAFAQRLDIELLVLFPYLLYRFATEFVPPSRRLQQVVTTLTVGLTIWTFALRHIPATGEHRSRVFLAYIFVFLAHWTILSVAVTRRLSSAGNEQPTVAATRMRLLAFASAALTVAIIGVAFAGVDTPAAAVTQALGFAAGIGFLLGLDPPGFVRSYWRRPENERMQEAIRGLMTLATTRTEIAHRVLGPSARVVGARGAALYDDEGEQLATFGTMSGDMVRVEQPGATLVAWTSPYAPFFGDEEIRILDTIAALAGLALDRVRLFEHEHESRVRLERANELMTNFVALAAHELRTPVTTVHGFVHTLNHLGDRLDEDQKAELRLALAQQTTRMASLVEQLLDLSRLDADSVTVKPQRIDVRTRLLEVVAVAAGARIDEVEVDAPEGLEASLDPGIVEHIVTNLVTNALRYGTAPVRVSAVGRDGAVRIIVQDAGPGVAPEIEETLFERFTRAGVARDRVAGTGLGLAIARAYARAHRGDLHYERGQPTGACFVVELPSVSSSLVA